MSEVVELNIKGLSQLVKALKSKPPQVRVGVIGVKAGMRHSKNGESVSNLPTNAEVGAVHEFGSPAKGIPQRSFLRIPIAENLQKEMESSGALDKAVLEEVLRRGSVVPWVKKIALLAEGIVLEAFASGGFGKWPAWKNSNYSNNANMLLVDTAQLRNSISSEVKE